MSGKRKNVALIGAGRMGSRWAAIIKSASGAVLKLVVDRDLRLAKKTAALYRAGYSTDSRDALRSEIDAVVIVTPHKFLYPLARAALLAGKHVLVEKPGSRTSKEMIALDKLARKKKLRLVVGFNYRSFDSISKAKKIADEGTIGKVQYIRIRHGHPGRPGYEKEWRMNKDLAGGGVLMDQGLHVIDLANWFFGKQATKVSGMVSNVFWKAKVEDNAFIMLKTQTGQIASLHVSLTEWKPVFTMEIFGDKGYIVIPGLGRKYGDGKTVVIGRYDHKNQSLQEKEISCNPDADRALRLEFNEFIYSIKGKRDPIPSARDAAKVLQIIEKVYGQN